MTTTDADAVVIGGGPNGLVAAIALADAGWDVVLIEANDSVGGAVRSAEITSPGFINDLFSAFYPLAAASSVIGDLDLGQHGLEWVQAAAVLSHVTPDGRSATIHRDPADTADDLETFANGDGQRWLDMVADWQRLRVPLLDAMFTPLPPLRAAVRLLRAATTRGTLDLARLAVLPVRRLAREAFAGDGAALLLTGNAMHADVPPDAAGSGIVGWLLAMLGQDVGFPVPRGGAQNLARALQSRLQSAGGQVRTGCRVDNVVVRNGRALGVRLADGTYVRARKAVLADVDAPALYRQLVGLTHLPSEVAADLDRFQWDNSTMKVNWALGRPVGWTAQDARSAGTVHLGVDVDGFVDYAADLSLGRMPREPFVLFGQMTTADRTRSPAGTESAWAYTHLPQTLASDWRAVDAQVEKVQGQLEAAAPGFSASILSRTVQTPADLEAADSNLVGGAINGGSSYPHQQLFFRPGLGLGRPDTPIDRLFLASASAHPGGGVHGACGWNAAVAALHANGPRGLIQRRLLNTAWERLLPR